MSFEKWLIGFEKELIKIIHKEHKEENLLLISPELSERLLHSYVAYKTQISTNSLVRATWTLAIFTIILSIITLFLNIIILFLK